MAETPKSSTTGTLSQTNQTMTQATIPSGASTSNASPAAPYATPSTNTISTPTMSGPSNGFQIPQISAATEAMIARIRGSAVGAGSILSGGGFDTSAAGLEAARRSVLQGMKTTVTMEINTPPPKTQKRAAKPPPQRTPSTASARKGSTKGKKAGSKRKRVKDESDSLEDEDEMSGVGDDSEDDEIVMSAKQTKSGRKVSKPSQFVPPDAKRRGSKRSLEQTLCKRCGRGHSPASNMIVFCDRCNLGWHQMCHDPPISEEMVKDENLEWFCVDCSIKNYGFDPNLYVGGREKSMSEKRDYFSSLAQPQLVSLLLYSTTLYPDLPVFPATSPSNALKGRQSSNSRPQQSDRKTNVHPQPPFPPSATRGLFSRAEANPNAKMNFIRKIPAGGSAKANATSKDASRPGLQHSSSAPPILPQQAEGGEDDESRESTPASPPYPRPGNGLMAKLPPDDQDDEWLVDDDDYSAFSHIVYDANGNGEKIEENGVLVNEGMNGNSTT